MIYSVIYIYILVLPCGSLKQASKHDDFLKEALDLACRAEQNINFKMSSSGDIVMMGYEHAEPTMSRGYEQEERQNKEQQRVQAMRFSTPEKSSFGVHGPSYVSTPPTKGTKMLLDAQIFLQASNMTLRDITQTELHAESRRVEVMQQHISEENETLRSKHRGLHSAGPITFERKYLPFAAGFSHMADEAAVYRSSRLHTINPTAAVSDDISYYYTLDSGRVPPAAMAANPETAEEFVRNTMTATHGGMWRRLMKPIE